MATWWMPAGFIPSSSHAVPVGALPTATTLRWSNPALVAQRIRASDYGSEGWGFESLRARSPLTSSFSYETPADLRRCRSTFLLSLLSDVPRCVASPGGKVGEVHPPR